MTAKRISRKEFFHLINELTFNPVDEREAFEFGFQNCCDSLRKAVHWEARYIVFEEDGVIHAVGIVQRDGFLTYYTTDKARRDMRPLFYSLRGFVNETVRCCGGLRVEVARFHKEAVRLLKLLGFRILTRGTKSDIYALEEDGRKD